MKKILFITVMILFSYSLNAMYWNDPDQYTTTFSFRNKIAHTAVALIRESLPHIRAVALDPRELQLWGDESYITKFIQQLLEFETNDLDTKPGKEKNARFRLIFESHVPYLQEND